MKSGNLKFLEHSGPLQVCNGTAFSFYTSTEEIDKIIKSLKTKNARGYNEISIKILKLSAPFISSPLTYILNKSLELGVLFHLD